MLSIEEISDRIEIAQLLTDYSTAIDQKRFDDLDVVFTADAYIDYRVSGGIDGRFPEVKAWLKEVLPNFPAYFHLVGNVDIRIAGDNATSRAICFNPIVMGGGGGQNSTQIDSQVYFVGIWYVDEFVRTPQGWRMNSRVEEKCFDKLV